MEGGKGGGLRARLWPAGSAERVLLEAQRSDEMEFVTVNFELQQAFSPLLSEEVAQDLVSDPDVMALGAVEGKRPCGVLVFALEETQLRLLWLCTAEEMRGRGVARALVRQLVKCAARDPEAGRLFADVPDSSPLDPVFLLLLSEGWIPSSFQLSAYTCTLAQLAEQEFWRKNMGEAGVTPVSQLPKVMLKEYSALLDGGEGGAPVQLPLRAEDYEPDVSLGYVSEGKLQACALFTYQDGQLVLSYAQAQPSAKSGIAKLFYAAGKRALAKYPPETRLSFAAVTPAARQLAEKLLPVCGAQSMYRMSLWLPKLTEGGTNL